MIVPPFLQSGNTIGIVAPGRKVSAKDIEVAQQIIESWGVRIVLGKNIFSDNHSYLSGTDNERRTDVQAMLDDPLIKTIICARGGYGTTRFVDQLDFRGF